MASTLAPPRIFFVSAFWVALVPAPAQARGGKSEDVQLTEKQARDPASVASWRKTNANTADRQQANWFFEQGLREKKAGNGSAAGKAFSESMLRFPDPWRCWRTRALT